MMERFGWFAAGVFAAVAGVVALAHRNRASDDQTVWYWQCDDCELFVPMHVTHECAQRLVE